MPQVGGRVIASASTARPARLGASGPFLALALDLVPPACIGQPIQKLVSVVAGRADETLADCLLPGFGNLTLVDAQVPRDQAEAGSSVLIELHEGLEKFL
jgi:hypothetical protein